MKYDVALNLENREEAYSFGYVAKQANGSAWLKSGKTVILATVVIDETEVVKDDFLPLTVQYIEKTYAAGKIPGGFFKRETKPSDFETLTSRIVDRSLRPLFPKGFGHPTQITIMVFSADADSDMQVLALNAASAALYVSDIDINRSVSAVRAAKVDGELVLNPTLTQLKNSTLDLYLSGTKEELLMIEMRSIGGEKIEVEEIPEPVLDPIMDPSIGTVVLSEHVSNAMSEDELIELIEALNPNNEEGRLNLIVRMGASKIAEAYPALLKKVRDAGKNVVWTIDPMHGNVEKSSTGFKTRNFDNILSEVEQFFAIHKEMGTVAAGIHLEMTGNNVTECTGSTSCAITDEGLASRYHTQCDPRLNASQALELAFMLSDTITEA